MDHIAEKDQKNHVIVKYLLNKQIIGHALGSDRPCYIREVIQGTDHIVLDFNSPPDFSIEPKLRLSTILARYLELHCTYVKALDGNRVEMKVDKIAIAKKERSTPRYPVVEEDFAKITHIVSSKTIIEANMFNIPTLVRVSFDEYQRKLEGELGANVFIKVDVFGSNADRELEVIKKTMKPIFIADCYKEESYDSDEDGFLNYSEEVDDQLPAIIKKHKDKQISSILIIPIIYVNELEEQIPIGYVSIQTKENRLTKEKAFDLMNQTLVMVDRIKDANLTTSEEKFPVVDVSLSGLQLKINNPTLINTLPKQKGFIFDLFFKMQSPFRFTVKVAWARKNEIGELLLGVEFTGKSGGNAERARFEQNVEVVRKLATQAA